jgi:prepilin-type processing-associated H-X9-DG protein
MLPRVRTNSGRSVVETTIVIIIVGVLLSIIMPIIGMVRENALGTRCQQRLRILGHAVEFYMVDYNFENWLPASDPSEGGLWFQKLEPFVSGHEEGRARENFVCPRAPFEQRGFTRETISFGWNEGYLPFGTLSNKVASPNETVLVADSLLEPIADTVLTADGKTLSVDPRHRGNANILFVGGNVGAMPLDELKSEWPRYWDRE